MSQISQILIAFIIDTKMPLVVVYVITNMTFSFEKQSGEYVSYISSFCSLRNTMNHYAWKRK